MSEMNVAEKLHCLLDYIGLSEVGYTFKDYEGLGLIAMCGYVLLITDAPEPDRDHRLASLIHNLRQGSDPRYANLSILTLTGSQFLAFLHTDGLYKEFRDNMGFAIQWPRHRRYSGFFGLGDKCLPDYGAINRALKHAGFAPVPSRN